MQFFRISVALAGLLAGTSLTMHAQVYAPEGEIHPHPHPAPLRGPAPAAQSSPTLATVSHTLYTTQSELYAEYKPLVAGQTTRFTAHLTKLGPSFRPYTAGQVTARLQGGNSPVTATAAAPEAPGIFRFQLAPTQAGPATLVVDIVTPEFKDQFTISGVVVYVDEAAAHRQPRNEEAGDITYIKEKAWLLPDFATWPLALGTLKGKGRTPATTGLVVPLKAVVTIDGLPHVYVQRTGERFQLRRVQTGPGDGKQVLLTSGVREGERVVVGGAQAIQRATPPPAHGHAH